MFKKMRGIGLSYEKQGLVYFICANYNDMPEEVQKKIDQLCIEVAGAEYYQALRDVLIKQKSIETAAFDCPCDETTLRRKRRNFYLNW